MDICALPCSLGRVFSKLNPLADTAWGRELDMFKCDLILPCHTKHSTMPIRLTVAQVEQVSTINIGGFPASSKKLVDSSVSFRRLFYTLCLKHCTQLFESLLRSCAHWRARKNSDTPHSDFLTGENPLGSLPFCCAIYLTGC